jgi:DNA-binding NtrC family response regulator
VLNVAGWDTPVLFTGETGVGKTVFARLLHQKSRRAQQPFVPFDCQTTESLFHDQLCGHARGAYTDAGSSLAGVLGEAKDGSLFLDNIQNLGASAQATLLAIIGDNFFYRLGESVAKPFSSRLILASNVDVRKLVEDGVFKEDLMYRVSVYVIRIPPLRERPEDIAELVPSLAGELASRRKCPPVKFGAAAIRMLQGLELRGNVRELSNLVVRCAFVAGGNNIVAAADVKKAMRMDARWERALKKRVMERDYSDEELLGVLAQKGSLKAAGKEVGVDRKTIRNWLLKRGLMSSRSK